MQNVMKIEKGVNLVNIRFKDPFNFEDYQIFTQVRNLQNYNAPILGTLVISQDKFGFSVRLSGLTESPDYELMWGLMPVTKLHIPKD